MNRLKWTTNKTNFTESKQKKSSNFWPHVIVLYESNLTFRFLVQDTIAHFEHWKGNFANWNCFKNANEWDHFFPRLTHERAVKAWSNLSVASTTNTLMNGHSQIQLIPLFLSPQLCSFFSFSKTFLFDGFFFKFQTKPISTIWSSEFLSWKS